MVPETRKKDLSEPRQHLVELMQEINFGQIEALTIRNGEPVFKPAPRVSRVHKFGAQNDAKKVSGSRDFVLRKELTELFHQFDELGTGVIESIEVRHGLPFWMRVEERISA